MGPFARSMRICVVPGPGNGKELMDGLARMGGVDIVLVRNPDELAEADLIVTPRGPSRSFSKWYQDDPLGQAVVTAHQRGASWLALCGSALPLMSVFGTGCAGITALSLLPAKGTNDVLQGQDDVETPDGRRLPFHFTSAPVYEAGATEGVETLAKTEGLGSVVRGHDLVVSSGLPLTEDGWSFLFEAAGCPVRGARATGSA